LSIESLPVSAYMSRKGVITEITEQNIYAACRVMSENNIGCVIIVDKSHVTKPLGIITERDVVLLGTLKPDIHRHTIRQHYEQAIGNDFERMLR
jgi:CBS domain-containing protein